MVIMGKGGIGSVVVLCVGMFRVSGNVGGR